MIKSREVFAASAAGRNTALAVDFNLPKLVS